MAEIHVRQGAAGEGGSVPTLAAAAAIAKAGDVVVVHEGVYPPFRPPAGTTWQAADGERPVIDGGWKGGQMNAADAKDTGVGIGKPNVTLRGLEVRNVAGRGVVVGPGGDGFVMEGCEIHHTVNGGFVANGTGTPINDITIRGCHVHDIAMSGKWDEVPVNGCFLFKSAQNVLVEDCLIERGYGEGMAAGSRSKGLTFRRVTIRDTRHLLMYVANRAQDVLVEDCVLYQRGLEEFRQSDGQVGGGLVVGDEESGAKDDSWQHGENVTIRRCVVVNAGKLFELRNQKKVGSGGGQDGYNTTIKDLTVEHCTFVAGPDTRSGVNISENEYGDGKVGGRFEANVFIGAASFRNAAAGVAFTGNGFTAMPPGLAADNIHIPVDALVAPFATIGEWGLNLNDYRPRAGSVVALGNLGALAAADEPPPPPPPDPDPTPVDWARLLELASNVGVQLATATQANEAAREQLAVASLATEAGSLALADLLLALDEYRAA
jgi:hypothetical protein